MDKRDTESESKGETVSNIERVRETERVIGRGRESESDRERKRERDRDRDRERQR